MNKLKWEVITKACPNKTSWTSPKTPLFSHCCSKSSALQKATRSQKTPLETPWCSPPRTTSCKTQCNLISLTCRISTTSALLSHTALLKPSFAGSTQALSVYSLSSPGFSSLFPAFSSCQHHSLGCWWSPLLTLATLCAASTRCCKCSSILSGSFLFDSLSRKRSAIPFSTLVRTISLWVLNTWRLSPLHQKHQRMFPLACRMWLLHKSHLPSAEGCAFCKYPECLACAPLTSKNPEDLKGHWHK